MTTKQNRCYVCGNDNPNVLQTHHIVPRRHGGGDHESNLVCLCANCHQAIESLYDARFYRKLGLRSSNTGERESEQSPGYIARRPVASFVDECLTTTDAGEYVLKKNLYLVFNAFLEEHGLERRDFDQSSPKVKFGQELKDAIDGWTANRKRNGGYAQIGVELTYEGERLLKKALPSYNHE